MKYRLLMLTPVFEEGAVPEVVREDVAEACTIIMYDSPEELSVRLHDAVNSTIDFLNSKDKPGTETPA